MDTVGSQKIEALADETVYKGMTAKSNKQDQNNYCIQLGFQFLRAITG